MKSNSTPATASVPDEAAPPEEAAAVITKESDERYLGVRLAAWLAEVALNPREERLRDAA